MLYWYYYIIAKFCLIFVLSMAITSNSFNGFSHNISSLNTVQSKYIRFKVTHKWLTYRPHQVESLYKSRFEIMGVI